MGIKKDLKNGHNYTAEVLRENARQVLRVSLDREMQTKKHGDGIRKCRKV